MSESTAREFYQQWAIVERARKNSKRCYLCLRIARGCSEKDRRLETIKICGVDFPPEFQVAHVGRCREGGRRDAQ